MLNIVLQAVKKQKEFYGNAVKKFAQTFRVQTAKIVKKLETREKKRKILLLQLLLLLKKPKL